VTLRQFLAAQLPNILSVAVVIYFAVMAWRVWKNRP